MMVSRTAGSVRLRLFCAPKKQYRRAFGPAIHMAGNGSQSDGLAIVLNVAKWIGWISKEVVREDGPGDPGQKSAVSTRYR